jgi:transcriptional regulator with XRE-family HTH domain
MPNTAAFLDPKMLGFWLRCVRQAQKWSQEALAATAKVDVRTVQRMEAGKTINVTSRRAITTALGYDKPDAFEEPEFIKGVLSLFDAIEAHQREELKKQTPDGVSIKAARITNGSRLGRLAYESNALSLQADDDISNDAKIVAAELFDLLRLHFSNHPFCVSHQRFMARASRISDNPSVSGS